MRHRRSEALQTAAAVLLLEDLTLEQQLVDMLSHLMQVDSDRRLGHMSDQLRSNHSELVFELITADSCLQLSLRVREILSESRFLAEVDFTSSFEVNIILLVDLLTDDLI